VFSEAIEAEGAIVFKKACELDVEGIVSKRQARKPHVDGLAADRRVGPGNFTPSLSQIRT